jgi:uncharacterized alpha-E superfamily protein
MLSRMAWHLFWLGRYAQRAAGTAKVVAVSSARHLLPPGAGGGEQPWRDALAICADPAAFAERFRSVAAANVLVHLVLDDQNWSSLRQCVAQARENARIARGHVSPEAWESINDTWLDLNALERKRYGVEELAGLGERIAGRIHHFVGTVHSSLLHDDAFQWILLGSDLERASHTNQLLSIGAASGEDPGRWETVLALAGAETAYRAAYGSEIDGARVCALLVEHPRLPCSLRTCAGSVARRLAQIAGPAEPKSPNLAADLALRCSEGSGLRSSAWLDATGAALTSLGDALHSDYLVLPCSWPYAM